MNVRVSFVPTLYGEKGVLRFLTTNTPIDRSAAFGMSGDNYRKMKQLLRIPHGIIYFTGPTGSGKTTTLYSVLQYLSSRLVNIVTIEDPVERNLPKINQIQVNDRAGLNFQTGLRSILRQDPDIIMIGEMRDFDTAHIGIQASLTGHLVFSTLHTNDSISAVTRLSDMGVEPYLISGSLLGVVAQRLVRRVCPHCKKEIPTSGVVLRNGIEKAWRGVGCERCNGTGYRGRFGLYEQFDVTPEIQDAIARGAPMHELRDLARKGGFATLLELGLQAVREGETTPEEMLRVVGEV